MSAYDDLERYRSIPLCRDCVHFRTVERPTGWFGLRKKKDYVCDAARPEPVFGGVMYNSDAAEMRRSGPCGPAGALFRSIAEPSLQYLPTLSERARAPFFAADAFNPFPGATKSWEERSSKK